MGPRTSLDQVFHGIEISSRSDDPLEIDTIKRAVQLLKVSDRFAIHSIWCDSKACACYGVELCKGFEPSELVGELDQSFREAGGGHNGIFFEQAGESFFADPWWPEEEE